MKAKVDKEGCISCGLCVDTCPEVFRIGDDGTAEAYEEVLSGTRPAAEEAAQNCPTAVIVLSE